MKTEGNLIMGAPITGSSAIIGPDGRIIQTAKSPGEGLIVADVNLNDAIKAKLFADGSGHCTNPPTPYSSLLKNS